MIPETLRQEIAAQSIRSAGRDIPWNALREKRRLSLGFLGGSVTSGYVSGKGLLPAYPALAAEALRKEGTAVTETVCAAPGMDSMLGNLLSEETVLAQQPDIIFLDFSINETTLRPSVMSFESLVRKLLSAPSHPVVCLILLRTAHGYSCEGYMEPIAEHYGLPCINLKAGLNPALERGALEFSDYGDEESHPTPDGQALLAESILHLLRTAPDMPEKPFSLPEPWLHAPFAHLMLRRAEGRGEISLPMPYFPKAVCINEKNGAWEITLTCRVLCIVYGVHRLPELGACRVLLDGQPVRDPVLHSDSIYGWGNPRHRVVLNADEAAEHTLRLEPVERDFILLALGTAE